ncbi:hypothetical protein [Goodfellowiella coeruleoviolacea]|uniref:ABC-2 type transport system permease protein n=1 Tax=Goodfellowiella coeruleoviolacea TaxID=334858 RepID=A0AAE3GF60_9PSEU|nr:hypothetical protein [Goodfellowiella coeruleoviolacea]MCP2166227.1 ABC-2 type transport system permease protein [Goodfellowiella coeruleoviolacea]
MTLLAVERIKLFSTRSPWLCVLLALGLTVGFAGLLSLNAPADYLTVSATQAGYQFGLMVMMVMAALAITTEYRFGTIRATFQAVPNRTAALLAKTVLVTVLAGLIGEIAAFGSWGVATVLQPDVDLALHTEQQWRNVAGVGLVFAFGAVASVGVGLLIRHSAGALSVLLLFPMLVEELVQLIPRVGNDIHDWMPFVNAERFLTGNPADGSAVSDGMSAMPAPPLSPWGSMAYFAAATIAVLVAGLVVANRRDA